MMTNAIINQIHLSVLEHKTGTHEREAHQHIVRGSGHVSSMSPSIQHHSQYLANSDAEEGHT